MESLQPLSTRNGKEEDHQGSSMNNKKEQIKDDADDERRIMNISYSKWSQVEDGVLGMILQRLSLSNFLQIQAVCSSWRSSVLKFIANKHCLPPSPEVPLVFLHGTMEHMKYFSFLNLHTKNVSNNRLGLSLLEVESYHYYCHGTIQGWMIMVEANSNNYDNNSESDVRILFFNPLSKVKIFMPSRLKVKSKIKKIVASTTPNDPNCVVACLFDRDRSFAFGWINNSNESSWTLVEGSDSWVGTKFMIMDMEIDLHGKVYALTDKLLDSIICYDLQEKPVVKPKMLTRLPLLRSERIAEFNYGMLGSVLEVHGAILRTLAIDSSSGELLLIYLVHRSKFKYYDGVPVENDAKEYIDPPEIMGSLVFKLHMSEEPVYWIEVGHLGNRVLFVDDWKCLVVSSNNSNNVADDICGSNNFEKLIKKNCIYFAYRFPCRKKGINKWKGMKIGRHCRVERRIDYYTSEFDRSSFAHEVPHPAWFIPSLL